MESQSSENVQNAPVSSNDVDNLQNDVSNHREEEHKHDFEEHKHDFEEHKHEFEEHKHDFEEHKHDFEEHKHDFEEQKHDYEEQKHDFEEQKHDFEEQKHDFSREEVVQILQVIASTGKFWHDWDKLKSMLSFQLKQVLSEYPEAKMTSEQQHASLGESYSELVNRLDEALTCFIEGPPFTLQRLCEILLDAKSIYSNLSKLALALEKNLLVTSTLTICTDPYPQATTQEPDVQEKASEKQQQQSNSAENGVEPLVADKEMVVEQELVADKDEVMAEADLGDDMTIDMQALEDIKSSETNSEPNANNA